MEVDTSIPLDDWRAIPEAAQRLLDFSDWKEFGGLPFPTLHLYALMELLIGVSGIVVPYELEWGRSILERLELASSPAYYSASGVWVAFTLVPWCALMGATIPVATEPKMPARAPTAA